MVVEGAELLTAAFLAGAPIEAVYVSPEGRSNRAASQAVERVFASGVRVFDIEPGVLERIAGTVSPQPVLAVVGYRPMQLGELVTVLDAASPVGPGRPTGGDAAGNEAGDTGPAPPMVVVLVDVRDPGNAGTIIRTSDAAGSAGVICCDGTVDPTNPKVVRSSAGSLFNVAVVAGGDAVTSIERLQGAGLSIVGATAHGGTDYASFDWRRPVAVVLGNEAAGLQPAVTQALDELVSVPIVGSAESLNVSVAAGVICFEAVRQRRRGSPAQTGGGGGA